MDHCFKEGQEVLGIVYPDDSEINIKYDHVDKITVVLEYGQMAGVPWFAVWKNGKITSKHNGAFLACVTL